MLKILINKIKDVVIVNAVEQVKKRDRIKAI